MSTQPHRRFNPLTGDWVLVSPQRQGRPWQGQQESHPVQTLPDHDPQCYLCPRNSRSNGQHNPNYPGTFVFTNDYPALTAHDHELNSSQSPFFQREGVHGTCRVICFSPQHNLTLANMDENQIIRVIECWRDQITELKQHHRWIQIFENKGLIVGCSNPHPHGQIWASTHLPNEARKELATQAQYYQQHQSSLLLDYVHAELEQQQRIVLENDDWLVVVPYWATWPFETLLLPKFTLSKLTELNVHQTQQLATIIKRLSATYNNLFNVEFPYTMGWHTAPEDNTPHPYWQCHAHYYPPLLRSATVKKFMVGYELLAENQRDLTAEAATHLLREAIP